jgi:hypothetical protein
MLFQLVSRQRPATHALETESKGGAIMQRFEYKFVRLEQDNDWLTGVRPSKSALTGYQALVHQHPSEGWRLVQIFAPPIGTAGLAPYLELILERPQP